MVFVFLSFDAEIPVNYRKHYTNTTLDVHLKQYQKIKNICMPKVRISNKLTVVLFFYKAHH